MGLDLSKHPCFNDEIRHTFGRVHLPIAPKCNIQCNFCNRRYDCVNESRPGVTSTILTPKQALRYVDKVVEEDPRIAVVGIAGPGDPFANADETMETLQLVRAHYPEMLLCVASNGLNVAPYAEQLAELNVSHVTITINAIEAEIAAKVYSWVRDEKRIYRGIEGAQRLIDKQIEAVTRLCQLGITVKINTILIPGVNDDHIERVAETMSALGAEIFNCVPLYPVKNTPFAEIEEPPADMIAGARLAAGLHIKQMHHCTRCRADAVGLLGEATNDKAVARLRDAAEELIFDTAGRPYVAVASMEGMLVNQHLGEAMVLSIFKQEQDHYRLHETRQTPERGGGDERWAALGSMLNDCRAVLVSGAGPKPTRAIEEAGLRVIVTECLIEEGLEAVYNNTPIRSPARTHQCGAACSGTGNGCG